MAKHSVCERENVCRIYLYTNEQKKTFSELHPSCASIRVYSGVPHTDSLFLAYLIQVECFSIQICGNAFGGKTLRSLLWHLRALCVFFFNVDHKNDNGAMHCQCVARVSLCNPKSD